MAGKPTVLITGVSGNLGLRLLEQLGNFQVIGADVREPEGPSSPLFRFEKVDFGEERSCDQLLELMLAYRPEAVVHLAFVLDPLRSGVIDPKRMWNANVAGTSRVIEAIAEHNRMIGGIDKFIFPSSSLVYGPEPAKAIQEDGPLKAQSLPYALHQQEADQTVQLRAKDLRKGRTYLLRPGIYAGSTVENYQLGVLRGIPGGEAPAAWRRGCGGAAPACRWCCPSAAAIWTTSFSLCTSMTWRGSSCTSWEGGSLIRN